MNTSPYSLGSRFDFWAVHPSPNGENGLQLEFGATVAKYRSKNRKRGFHFKNCDECGAGFIGDRKESRFCSRECTAVARGKEQIGENNPCWKGGISKNFYHYKNLQVERYPERIAARAAVASAIRAGKLVRGPCEKCQKAKSHAHHDDYAKPLEVRWFCRKHHRKLHGGRH